jgi:hypothetical protein
MRAYVMARLIGDEKMGQAEGAEGLEREWAEGVRAGEKVTCVLIAVPGCWTIVGGGGDEVGGTSG